MILGWPIILNKKYIFFMGLFYSSLFSQSFACREKVIKVKICFNTLQKKDLYQNYFLFIDMVKNTKMVYPIKSKGNRYYIYEKKDDANNSIDK